MMGWRRRWIVTALCALAVPATACAEASPDLGKRLGECFALKSTGQDRIDLMRWLMVSWAASPRVQDVVKVNPEARVETDKTMARLVMRLLTVDCVEQAKPVLKAKDQDGMRAAFGAFGEIASAEIGGDKRVDDALGAFGTLLDDKALEQLGK